MNKMNKLSFRALSLVLSVASGLLAGAMFKLVRSRPDG